jgi:O-antigen/teichoic acid export membrane protein
MLAKKIASFFSFTIISAALGFFTIPYLTRVLLPEEYGIIGLFLSVMWILGPIISFSAIGLVAINKTCLDQEAYADYKKKYISFSFVVFLIVQTICLIMLFFTPQYLHLLIIAPLLAYIRFLNDFHSIELIQDGKAFAYGFLGLATTLMTLLLTVVFISLLGMGWKGRLLAFVLAEFLLLVLRYKVISKYTLTFKLDRAHSNEFIQFGLPICFAVGAGWLINQSDRFIVLHFFSLAKVGIYTAAYSIGTLLDMVNTAVVNAISPGIFKELKSNRGLNFIKKYSMIYSTVVLVSATLISMIAITYDKELLGPKYEGSGSIIALITFAFAFSGIYRTLGLVIDFYKKNMLKTVLLYICALTNIIFSLTLIPVAGLLAPAIGTVTAYFVLTLLVRKYALKELNFRGIAN